MFTYLLTCAIMYKAEESMILEKVKKLIADQLCISVDEIKEDSNIMEDHGYVYLQSFHKESCLFYHANMGLSF